MTRQHRIKETISGIESSRGKGESAPDFAGIDREKCVLMTIRSYTNPQPTWEMRIHVFAGHGELNDDSCCVKIANGVREIRKARSTKNAAAALTRRNTAGSKSLVAGCGPSESSPLSTLGHTRQKCEPSRKRPEADDDTYSRPAYVVAGDEAGSERIEQGIKNVRAKTPTVSVSQDNPGVSRECGSASKPIRKQKVASSVARNCRIREVRGATGGRMSGLHGGVCNSWRARTSCGARTRAVCNRPVWKSEQRRSGPERMASQLEQERVKPIGVSDEAKLIGWKGRGGSVSTTPKNPKSQLSETFQHRSLVRASEPTSVREQNEEGAVACATRSTRASCPLRSGQRATGTVESLIFTGA